MDDKKNIKLIDDINCKYIIFDNIFSYIPYNNILHLIKYNKDFQKKFEININIYKKRSGKYRILEKNGKGKEFTLAKNKLIFEGEYKNGIKTGKGKEYHEFNGKIKFDGDYLKGKRWNGTGFNLKEKKILK